MGVLFLGIATKEHFGEGEEAFTTDTFVAKTKFSVRATGKAVVLRGRLIAREVFGIGVLLCGITTKEHFGEGEEDAFTSDTFVNRKGRLVVFF
jgi:hypothetical protein